MKKLALLFTLLLSVNFLSTNTVNAQAGGEVGGWIGSAFYFGDLNPTFAVRRPGLAGGAVARLNLNPRLSVKVGASYGRIAGYDSDSDDIFQQRRNLSFESNILEGALQFEFNFLKYLHGTRDNAWTPYLFGGGVAFNYNPKTKYENEWVDLRPLGTEGQFRGDEYGTTSVGIVYGGGIKVALNYEWSINFEFGMRYLFTDYLDDVSTVYADIDDIRSMRGELAAQLADRSFSDGTTAPIGEAGRQRGNSKNNDSYAFVGLSILYNLTQIKCPNLFSR